ncbi:MAG: hypothetical protein COA31_009125 [Flavobacteriales bacterium]|nr:hypothetical protein [Flavobacteriales bacterium]
MRLIKVCESKGTFYANKIDILEVLIFLKRIANTLDVILLNSNDGDTYYYTEDLKKKNTINELYDFFYSKPKIEIDVFSFKVNDILFEIDDNYSMNLFSQNHDKMKELVKQLFVYMFRYNEDLINKIFNKEGKYLLVDLGIIIKEYNNFDEYIDDL